MKDRKSDQASGAATWGTDDWRPILRPEVLPALFSLQAGSTHVWSKLYLLTFGFSGSESEVWKTPRGGMALAGKGGGSGT